MFKFVLLFSLITLSIALECKQCEQIEKNRHGSLRCVHIPRCCPAGTNKIFCVVPPCQESKAFKCVPNYCDGDRRCGKYEYNEDLDLINP
ncbi:unnamed protein product [Bursaphelenchus xylophilus]|uniref:(pine wood nematode) hypothetical protein n=1 Tax=Bursaphelenchus xylophilus TaxID=6326 RepID=A0A1I7S4U9_BURXY|nr:unnamed protein product [Bursaphelenchus xylophilus]CAG9117392.1 unnamed protein product [Bursaphelenchus xylophilus]